MNDIFKEFIEINHGLDFSDILELHAPCFEKVGISLLNYEDDYDLSCYDSEDLNTVLKQILIKEAQNQSIIPEEWDLSSWFECDRDFAIILPTHSTEEERETALKVQKDFEEWSDIKLAII